MSPPHLSLLCLPSSLRVHCLPQSLCSSPLRSHPPALCSYVIPTSVVHHFLADYKRNGTYTGFPSLNVVWQVRLTALLLLCCTVIHLSVF